MEFVEEILYKKVNNGDLLNIDREIFSDATGGGQTYFDLGGIDQNRLIKFLEYGQSEEKDDPQSFEYRKKYTINVISLGSNMEAKLEFDPRKNRKNYKISDQRNNRHPAWLASSGFPTIPKGARYAKDITNIPKLFIFLVKTSERKYYAGFVNDKLPSSWTKGLGLERLLEWDKNDINKGFINFNGNRVVFNNNKINPFVLYSDYLNDISDNKNSDKVSEGHEEYTANNDSNKDDVENFELDFNNLTFEECGKPTGNGKLNNKRKFVAKKTNYEKKSRKNKNKGDLGEEAIVIMEQQRLKDLGQEELANMVKWVSKTEGDGLGYDIKSWDFIDGKAIEKYIEVKTTVGGIETPFDISDTEVQASKKYGERFFLYRIFDIKHINSNIKYYILNGDIEDNCVLSPTSYKVIMKIK